MVKEIKKSYQLIDIHVHPTEIIFNNIDYYPSLQNEGVYSKENCKYNPPKIEHINSNINSVWDDSFDERLKNRVQILMIKKLYNHIGPGVLNDHMTLSGIDKVLLLPVAPSNGSIEKQMKVIKNIYGNDDRFVFAYSVPNSVDIGNIYMSIKVAIDKYDIQAVKLHPNITEINLDSALGKERVEAILSACNELKLPLIVHGGKSPILKNNNASEYSTISNLEKIDWGIIKETVVIAHAGTYGCDLEEVDERILTRLTKMLNRYDNIKIDISGISCNFLMIVLRTINHDRILFGSDALYNMQCLSVVSFYNAISMLFRNIEEKIVQIMNINPKRYILKEISSK